jgi:hypothetical protein
MSRENAHHVKVVEMAVTEVAATTIEAVVTVETEVAVTTKDNNF